LRHGAELVVDALEMAIARRRPKPGLVHHSDQGSRTLVALRRGLPRDRHPCYDGLQKRLIQQRRTREFFATLEKDLLRRHSFATR